MAKPLAEALGAPRLLVGAREAGAGSLLACLLEARAADSNLLAVLEGPAERYFAPFSKQLVVLPAALSPDALRDTARKAIDAFQPDQIIVGASAGFTIEKALIEAAGASGVPVVSIVDHYWNLWQRYAGDRPTDRWRYRPDVIAVPDQWCRDRLRQLGCPVDSIVVFEHPLLWAPPTPSDPELRGEVREQLDIHQDALVVLFVSEYGFADSDIWRWDQPEETDIHAAADALTARVEALGASTERPVHVLVRPHPSEAHDWEAFAARHRNGLVLIGRTLTKPELFAVSDVAFGLNSMLLAEAGRSGLPSYSWFPDQAFEGLRLSQFANWIVECKDADACSAALRSVLAPT